VVLSNGTLCSKHLVQ